MNLLFSIHDVAPATLDKVRRIFDKLVDADQLPATLFVIPDLGWQARELDVLRELVARGAELAGHGWKHRADSIRGVRHRLHSALISRDVAEHLALDRAGCLRLMRDCFDWFGEHELPAPDLYVPPAWAMGSVSRSDLDELPFARFETLSGVYLSGERFTPVPMIGFEADTAFRAAACRIWNGLNRGWASLRLREDLSRAVAMSGTPVSYHDLGRSRG